MLLEISGKYKTKDVQSSGRYSSTNSNQGKIYRDRYFRDSIFEALQMIEPVAEKQGLTLLETALRWCVHHSALKVLDGNDGVIIGVSSLKQLEGNLRDLEKGPLREDLVQVVEEAWLVNKGSAPRYWHVTPPKP